MEAASPKPDTTQHVFIEVAGTERPDFWRYVLRFDREGRPSLYQDGHRLTCSWGLIATLTAPADPQGDNGNTSNG